MPLSRRQSQILQFIRQYRASNGYPPTVREIAGALGISSTSTVHHHLRALQAKGKLTWAPGKQRTLQILQP